MPPPLSQQHTGTKLPYARQACCGSMTRLEEAFTLYQMIATRASVDRMRTALGCSPKAVVHQLYVMFCSVVYPI